MRATGVYEAKQNFSALIEAVEAGEEVRITRHGREVVRMLPVVGSNAEAVVGSPALDPEADAALAALRRLRARVKPGPGWRELRDDGRKW